ncbi:uncharacterized protein Z519_12751 [Cladophialophora bantiana CBS 173.52]|uniref:Large ribosomal subunit protein mL54 n=1 Tax=Cladophialophora bantiana (strain ATCC 10958 / CBS 173.52 / CDC B-1940 / NIH 8579) TaxID=1442370 RepID=A0A0D2E935_CLAB1|nr:uncharacterized protein Z519_12751 [Cladophialophora bantiana CBS 173.52]KIW86626.1 hypothetical protein Z519_12751 [Cladophialophora bantiana CBS 173.52]
MICSSCRRAFLPRIRSFSPNCNVPISSTTTLRYASTVPATPSAAPVPAPAAISISEPNPTQSSNSSGISQPLSEPHTPSTSIAKTTGPTSTKDSKGSSRPKSSVPGGKELRGLGYTKAKPKVLALEDDEYPEWLWGLLDQTRLGNDGEKVDLSAMTKKQRIRYEKKQERLLKDLPKEIPVHEQSKDLTGPGDDALTSLQRRQEITKNARAARRRSIRENNFLKSM